MRIDNKYKMLVMGNEHFVLEQGRKAGEMTKILSFNETALMLWEGLKEKDFELEDVVDLLTSRYEVAPEQARKDAQEWVEMMKNNGMLD